MNGLDGGLVIHRGPMRPRDLAVDREFAPGIAGRAEVVGDFLPRFAKRLPHVLDGLVPSRLVIVQPLPQFGLRLLETGTMTLSHVLDAIGQIAVELVQRLGQLASHQMVLMGNVSHESAGRSQQVIGCLVDLSQRICTILNRDPQVVREVLHVIGKHGHVHAPVEVDQYASGHHGPNGETGGIEGERIPPGFET